MPGNGKKIAVTLIILIFLTALALFTYVNVKSGNVVPVLMYHTIDSKVDVTTPTVSPENFEMQMRFLKENHYNVVNPDKIIAYMTGKEKMPAKTVAITVDDGLLNFYENAYPLLKKYKLPATIFIITDRIGMPGYLGWKELREISDSGLVEVGCHTKSHPWMPTVSVDEKRLHEEISLSKEILESSLGKKIYFLCYPNGAFNDAVKDAAKKAGYKGAFTTNPTKKSAIDDIYAIRRIKMSSKKTNPIVTAWKLSRYYAWFKERR